MAVLANRKPFVGNVLYFQICKCSLSAAYINGIALNVVEVAIPHFTIGEIAVKSISEGIFKFRIDECEFAMHYIDGIFCLVISDNGMIQGNIAGKKGDPTGEDPALSCNAMRLHQSSHISKVILSRHVTPLPRPTLFVDPWQ